MQDYIKIMNHKVHHHADIASTWVVLAQAIHIPVLMLNGREESRFPLSTSQVPAYQLIGTAKEHKQHKLYPGGDEFYSMFQEQVHQDILSWLDRYLGDVE